MVLFAMLRRSCEGVSNVSVVGASVSSPWALCFWRFPSDHFDSRCARQAWLSYEAMLMIDVNRVYMGTQVYMIETLPRWGTMVFS